MSRDNWLELRELAEWHCPSVLLELELLTEANSLGVLAWLRRVQAEGVQP